MRTKQRTKLSDQIRQAIDASGVSRYAICKQIGLDQALLSRFMQGRSGLSVQTLDALADVLGLDLVARGPVRVSPPAKRGPKPKKGTKP
jgi:transcriptional regulator with XRE-family HTH domain